MGLLIHHLRLSQSERIIWLCEELGVPYELKCYDRDSQTKLAPAEYKALSPSQTSPVIQDGDITLAESAACVEYIINRYGGGKLLVKPSEPNYAQFLYMWHYAQGSLQPAVTTSLLAGSLEGPMKGFVEYRKTTAYGILNDQLAKSKYLAGDEFTAADILTLFYFTTMRLFLPLDLSAWPHLLRWVGEVGGRPAYIKALEKGDPGFAPFVDAKGQGQ